MAINPLDILKIKNKLNDFRDRHPGFTRFVDTLRRKGLPEGTVFEIKVTMPDQETMTTNFRVSQEDIELLRTLSDLRK